MAKHYLTLISFTSWVNHPGCPTWTLKQIVLNTGQMQISQQGMWHRASLASEIAINMNCEVLLLLNKNNNNTSS